MSGSMKRKMKKTLFYLLLAVWVWSVALALTTKSITATVEYWTMLSVFIGLPIVFALNSDAIGHLLFEQDTPRKVSSGKHAAPSEVLS